MKKYKPVSPAKPVHRITYAAQAGEQIVAPPETAVGTRRSPIRQTKSSLSPRRDDAIRVSLNFITSLNTPQQLTFSTRVVEQNWTEDGQEIRKQVMDHSADVPGSRMYQDLAYNVKLADLLALVRTLGLNDFDPVFTEASPETLFQYVEIEERRLQPVEQDDLKVSDMETAYFVQPQDFELYTLSFDAIIDYLKEAKQQTLTATLEQLKQYFLYKLVYKPTYLKALQQATDALDQQLLLQQEDSKKLNYHFKDLTMESEVYKQRYAHLQKYLVQLYGVISQMESEREGLKTELNTKTEHIKVLSREISNSQSLLSDALARCKRLSNASQKLKMQAERANERYNDAERQINIEQRKNLELEYEKTDYQHQAGRYKKEYEKMKEMWQEEQERNEVETSRLNAKIVQLSQSTGMQFNFKSENLGKISQEACQTLVKLSRFSDAELQAVQLDRDGIAALAYILDSADSAETVDKFLFAVKTDYRPGINKQSYTLLSWQNVDTPAQGAQKSRISYHLAQLKQEKEELIYVGRLQTSAQSRRNQILGYYERSMSLKDGEVQCGVSYADGAFGIYEYSNYEQTLNADIDDTKPHSSVQLYAPKPPIRYSSKNDEPKKSSGQLYSRQQVRERNKQLYYEQQELKKMMMDAIYRQKQNTNGQNSMSLLDVLEKHTNDTKIDEVDSDLSDNDIIIKPDEFLLMDEDQQLQYIYKFNDYSKDRYRRRLEDYNLLKSKTESQFNYKNDTEFFDNSSDDTGELGTGFLNTMFSSEVIKRKLGKTSSMTSSTASLGSMAVSLQELTQAKRGSEEADYHNDKFSKIQPLLARNQLQISYRETDADTLSDKRSNSVNDTLRPLSKRQSTGTTCVGNTVAVYTVACSIDAVLGTISQRLQQGSLNMDKEDYMMRQIGSYVQENRNLSSEELKTIAQVANSYVVHRIQAKEKGWAAPDTIYTLDNAVKAQLFYDYRQAQQIVQQQLLQDYQFQRIHQIVRQRIADQSGVINQEEFLQTNSMLSGANSGAGQVILQTKQHYEKLQEIEALQRDLEYFKQAKSLEGLTQAQKDIVLKQMRLLEDSKYAFAQVLAQNKQGDVQSTRNPLGKQVKVLAENSQQLGEVSVPDIIVPGFERQQKLLQRVINMTSGLETGYLHPPVEIRESDLAKLLRQRGKANESVLERLKNDLRRQGYDERLLEQKALKMAAKELASYCADEIAAQMVRDGKTAQQARAEAYKIVEGALTEIETNDRLIAASATPLQNARENPVLNAQSAAHHIQDKRKLIEPLDTEVLSCSEEVYELEIRFAEQNRRMEELLHYQLLNGAVYPANGSTDSYHNYGNVESGFDNLAKLAVSSVALSASQNALIVAQQPRLSGPESEEQPSVLQPQYKDAVAKSEATLRHLKHLKNSLYKDSKADGVLASLAKARAATEAEGYRENDGTKQPYSIVTLYRPKRGKLAATLSDIDDLEEAFADAAQEQAQNYLKNHEAIYQQAEEIVGQFTNPYLRQHSQYSAAFEAGQAESSEKQVRFEEFLQFISRKTFDSMYQIPQNTMIQHPINGACERYYVELQRLFGEQCFRILDEEEMLTQQFGLLRSLNLVNFLPCVVSRYAYRVPWYSDMKAGTQGTDLLSLTYYHYEDRKNAIFQRQTTRTLPRGVGLMPAPGAMVDFLREDALAQLSKRRPRILDLVQNYGGVLFQQVKIDGVDYLKVPLFTNRLKSLQWTLRTVRMIVYERQFYSTYLLTLQRAEKQFMQTELESPRVEDVLRLIPGYLNQAQAFSVAEFVFNFAVTRYGIRVLVLQLLVALITALAYYQYENSEIFIFARFLFDDLPSDFLLLYLELRKLAKVDVFNDKTSHADARELSFDVDYVPGLVNALFPNWDAKRKFVMAEQLVSYAEAPNPEKIVSRFYTPYMKGASAADKPHMQVSLAKATALVLAYYSVFRCVTYRNCQFLVLHFARTSAGAEAQALARDEQVEIAFPALRQLFECAGLYVDAKEFFLSLPQPFKLAEFAEFFQKYELGRFAVLAPAVLKGHLDTNLLYQTAKVRDLCRDLNLCFQLVGKYCRGKLAKLSGEQAQLKAFLQREFGLIQRWFQIVESDIRVFDCERGLAGLQRIGQEMVQCLNCGSQSYDIEIAVVQTLAEVVKDYVGY